MDKIEELEENLNHLLYNETDGLLMKFHFSKGIDYDKLDKLYTYLEEFKSAYMHENLVPKRMMFILIGIVPSLYLDINLYVGNPSVQQEYFEVIYQLDTALMMCLNPDQEGPFMNTPLKNN